MAKTKKKDPNYNQCGHILLSYSLSYLLHSEEMERRMKKKVFQKQCPKCGLWLYKDEQATDPENIGKLP
jgi:hypothetical protein